MEEDARTILSYLKDPNSRYGAHTWQSVNGEVKVQWLPDEGRGWIDIENPKGVKGASGFRKLMRSTLPKLDVISEIPAKWEWNPDDIKKGGIYEYLGPKMKGSFKANPNMPNKASVWDTRPKSKGTIMGVKKKSTPQTKKQIKEGFAKIIDANIAKAHKDIPGFTERLAAKKLTPQDSAFLRTGVSRNVVGPGGENLVTTGVSRYAKGDATLPGLGSKEAIDRATTKRKTSRKTQTITTDESQLLKKSIVDDMIAEQIGYWDVVPKDMIEAHHIRMLNMYEPFFEGLSGQDQRRLTQWATDNRYPLGDVKKNIALLDENFHTELHNYMKAEGFQLHGGGVTTKHGIPPLGTTFESRKAALSKFFTNVQDPIEKKMYSLMWKQQEKYKPMTPAQMKEGLEWLNDNEIVAAERDLLAGNGDVNRVQYGNNRVVRPDVLDRLKTPPKNILQSMSKATKLATGLGRAESAVRLASGDVVGGTAGLALSTPIVQRQIGKQIVKAGLRSLPGVSIASGIAQGVGYAASGQYGKAALSIGGGVVGEFGPAGDVAQAAIDLSLTGHDIASAKGAKVEFDSLPNRKKLLHTVGSLR